MEHKYMPDDKVAYTGSKFAKDIGGAQGWVICEVRNDPGLYVVEFGMDSYLIRSNLLADFKAPPKEEKGQAHGVEIRHNRRRATEEEA